MKRLALLLLFLAAACTSTAPPADDGRSDAGVRAAMSGFLEALNALDAEGMASYFADDITAFFPVSVAERVNGKAAVTEVFRTYAAETKKNVARTNIVPEEMQIMRSGDVAVVTFFVHNPAAVSRRTFVFRREATRWRVVHLHASNYRTASP
jgi:ketosteroid isomerase-like protein